MAKRISPVKDVEGQIQNNEYVSRIKGFFAKLKTIKFNTPKTPDQKLIVAFTTFGLFLAVAILAIGFIFGALFVKLQNLTPTQPTVVTKPVVPLHVAKSIGMDADKFKSCLDSDKYTKAIADDIAVGQALGVSATPTTFVNGIVVVGAEDYSAFKTIIDQELLNPNGPVTTGTRVTVENGNFPVMGNSNAPVTIVEFADFQCPFCEQFFKTTEKSIINDYVKTGKAKFVFRNYAFLGAESDVAAQGAYCANEQGKFWDYHNFLYTHQGQENSGNLTKANLE